MKKVIFYFLVVIVHGLCVFDCYAEQDLQVLTPNRQAKVAHQVVDQNKVLISALDLDDNPIRGLQAEDFSIMIGAKKAKILSIEPLETNKEVPLNLVLVVDNSYSMKNRKAVEPLISAIEEFLKIVRPMDNVHMVVFDEKPGYKVHEHALHARTYHSEHLHGLMKFIRDSFDDRLTTETFLYEAMVAGLDLILKMPERSN